LLKRITALKMGAIAEIMDQHHRNGRHQPVQSSDSPAFHPLSRRFHEAGAGNLNKSTGRKK
jgi:hypothetical protein